MRRRSHRQNRRESSRPLRKRLGRALRVLTAVVLLASAAVVAWFIYESPLLQVRQVSVAGAESIDPSVVADVSGLRGQNIIQADTAAAKSRLLALPMVKDVSIERRWPGRMLVRVQERRPWGYWQVKEQPYVIDDEGVVLDDARPDEGAPTIFERDSERRLAAGDRVDADAVALSRQLLDSAPTALKRDVVELEYSEHSGLTAAFEGGLRATFGDSRDLDYKLSVLYVLLKKGEAQSFAVNSVDLRFGGNVSFQ
ncbi:MAG TPA: FtsQ-type POTRA domain-containing protein [Dehalococcoidia bacterium]|nr:FtsQ-type POTRA domain-containing protein [Dehalococcoidia bacterium]